MKVTIEIEIPETIDLAHAYKAVSDALYLPENVTQAEYDLVTGILEKIQKEVFPSVPSGSGWGLFYTGVQDSVHNLYEIQRVDDECIFHDDNDAIRYVVMMAIVLDGKGIEADVIRWLMRSSPNEVDNVIRNAVPEAAFNKLMEVCK